MNIIIIGCGKVGAKFAQVLSEEGHDIVIVDNDKNAFKLLKPNFNGITVTGVPIDQDVLKHAGIETVDALAAVTPDDNVNIMVCQVAREIFKVPRVIARIYNPEREHVFHQFGLDTICPTNLTVDIIRSKILDEAGLSRHSICGESFAFRTKSVGREEEGRRLGAIQLKGASSIFGIQRKGAFLFPNPGIKLEKGDILVIADLIH